MRISFNNLPFEKYIEEQRKYGLDQKTLFTELRRGYAPLNFDADSKKHALKIARALKKKYGKKEDYAIMFRKSSSRRGFHFTIFYRGKQLFLPVDEILKIRKRCFDCYGRLKADIKRAKWKLPISILFHHKNLKNTTAYRELIFLKNLK
jgi:hypothetical protein